MQAPSTAQEAPTTAPEAPRQPPVTGYELSPYGTKWAGSTRPRGRGADFDNARAYFSDPGISGWMEKMRSEPSTFTQLLSDIFRETKAEQERAAGRAKIGRRPKVIEGALSDLWDMITPRYSVDPFPAALTALIGSISPAEFAHRTTISPDTFRAMMTGQKLDMWRIEVVARAFQVSPAYFREWRHDYVLTVVGELLDIQPNLSVRYAKALNRVAGPPRPSPQARRAARASG